MSLAQYFNAQFSAAQNLDLCLRLILACVCGAAIGFERSKRFKEAGIRTHIIVCCAAALFMIVSKYAFVDLTNTEGVSFNGTRGADPARVAAQVVSGISFLCAGVIFKNGGAVKGLTTAAGIWITAAIGLAIGSGMFVVGLVATFVVALLQFLMHHFAIGADAYATNRLLFTVESGHNFHRALMAQMNEWKATVVDSKITRHKNGTTDYDFTVRRRSEISYDEFKAFMDRHDEIYYGSNSPLR